MFCLPLALANADSLDEADISRMHSDIRTMMNHFELGHVQPILDSTHESIFTLLGGKAAYSKSTKTAIDELKQLGFRYISMDYGKPTQLYQAGDEELCFVPLVSIMEVQGNRVKSTSFMVAIRKRGSDQWKYIDGAGVAQNPQVLQTLFPKLETGVELPPYDVTTQ